ncbi:hypothetical protein [Clostridium perfringens]|uniref:hypothetical protein n=1 Tax=Clostridium perfringens TaxID=1502 RepID=UPI0024BD379E|nr:hypothetical protein [Clostridium perfringens]
MDINFSQQEILFIYGHFRKEAQKLITIKNTPGCPIDSESITREINLYSSIADKIEKVYPQFSEINSYFKAKY